MKKASKEEKLIGPPKLTKYEIARIIGARALQIEYGAPILIELPKEKLEKMSPIDIALEELRRGVLPIIIRRRLPDGRYQDIPIIKLLKKTEIKMY